MATKRVHTDSDLAKHLIEGTNRHLANAGQLIVAGSTLTPAEFTAQLQAIVNLRADVDAARAQTQAALARLHAQMPARRVMLDAAVSFVRGAFGTAPDVLADFGLSPKKDRTPLTVEQKAAAAVKRAATRKARHVMGSKQRKAVKGDVTGVVVTPIVAANPSPHTA
jgi:hypothetical protein